MTKKNVRVKSHKPDYILAVTVFILVAFGLVILSSASAVSSYENFGNNYYYFKHQLMYGVALGFIAWFIGSKIPYHFLRTYAFIGIFATIILLVLVFIPGIGFEFGGARRWILIGPFSLQPAEICKLTIVIYLAAWLENKGEQLKNFAYGFLPFIFILGLVGIFIFLQPDVGTLGVIMITSIIVYYVAGASIPYLAMIGTGLVSVFLLMIKMAPYRLARFAVFLNPSIDSQGIGYQINQALISVGSGGILGLGLGKSRQKYNYLPEATGDSIFAIVSEELGIIGATALILLFLLFLYRGIKIAKEAPDMFSKLVAIGITSWIIFQAFINIAAIISLIPLTGIPLPFISYGGSALMFSLFGVGILMNISRYTKPKKLTLQSVGSKKRSESRMKRRVRA